MSKLKLTTLALLAGMLGMAFWAVGVHIYRDHQSHHAIETFLIKQVELAKQKSPTPQ